MSAIDADQLLQEVSPEIPCGENLEYDPDFGELERAAQGKPEQQYGDTVVPAQGPDWGDVKSKALSLFPRTKDLRVTMHLVRALVNTDGLVGLRDGLDLMKDVLERYWETVHPQLDPEDNNDPTLRVNTIEGLCDPETMMRYVREAPLVSSRALGRFSLRDVQVAMGALSVPEGGGPVPEMSGIDAAFLDCDLGELQSTAEAVARSIDDVVGIESILTEQVGVGQAADLSGLSTLLKQAQQILTERLTLRGGEKVLGTAEAAARPVIAPAADAAAAAPRPVSGEIRSSEDAVRWMDKICEYFEKHEPSSPVPLLLRRARKLVSKDFMGIIRDLAPNGLPQVEVLRGVDTEEEQGM